MTALGTEVFSNVPAVLARVTLCAWPTASLSRSEYDAVRAAAAAHAARGGETFTLTTCQRIEVYSNGSCDCETVNRLRGLDVARHLAAVAGGLDAAVPGEEQVLGQVRSVLAVAPRVFQPLAELVIASARQLRREASGERDAGHILDRALTVTGIRPRGTLLVLGSGHLARLVAARGPALGFRGVVVGSRRRPEGEWAAALHHVSLAEISALDGVQVVAGCLGEGAAELDAAHDLPACELAVDLGSPRNFRRAISDPVGSPALNAQRPFVITIAELLEHEDCETAVWRTERRRRLHQILDERVARMHEDERSPVGLLRQEVELIRLREIERIAKLHPEIPLEKVEAITRSLVNKLFHGPSERLRRIDDPDLAYRFAALFQPAVTNIHQEPPR